jgi:SIR2-like domain
MSETFKDQDWDILLERIHSQRCVPFLGAGASFPAIPLGSTIASDWAQKYNYRGDNPKDLIEVAQYLAIQYDLLFPKEKICKQVDEAKPPDFNAANEPHACLADLPMTTYLTTNYDDFMMRALKRRERDVRRDFCRWNDLIKDMPSLFGPGGDWCDRDYPTVANPVVFHLHGYSKVPESIVLTEDDYLNFLAIMGREKLLPARIQSMITRSTCLFIGYRLADWNFRVLFQSLRAYSITGSIAVLKPPDDDGLAGRQREYLGRYYENLHLRVYWGTAREFTAELRDRWNKFESANPMRY